MPKQTISTDIIQAAIQGFESQKLQIDGKIAELRAMLSGAEPKSAPASSQGTKKKRTMSAEGRARIAEGQRKRWAATKESEPATAEHAARPKRKLSPAGRKAIRDAVKRRWAAKRAESAKG